MCHVELERDTTSKLGHDLEHHDKKDATCTEPGWEAYDTCKRAGCGYTTYQEIPALGHKYSQEWSNDKTYHWHASTCGHDVVSDKGKHTFDSNWVCTECAYVDTGLHGVELRTNTLELDGTDIYGKVSNATSTFSFINEIAIADSASYTVSTDINGTNVIRTKTVSLSIGDNTFYILVENGKDLGLYTVVIRRRPMYSVSFNVNGGTSVSAQTIEEDHFATEPTTERKGYTFDKWDYDFSQAIIKDTTITASWNIITYNVYYDLNVPSDSISQDVDNSMNVTTYTVEDAITFKTPSRKGYRFTGWDKNIEKGTIGDVTVTASWEAIKYDIVYDFGDADSVSKATNNAQNPSTYTIEDAITFAEPSRDGYTFVAWDKNIVRGTIDTQTITASWEIIEYDIVYDFCDADSVSKATNNAQNPSKYTIEDAITFAEPSRTGYTFIAWDKSIASGTIDTQTITASWKIVEYDIIYDFGDSNSVSKATNNKQNPSKYTIEDAITFAEPSRGHYTFVAWNIDKIVPGTTDTQTIVADWIAEQHTITYVLSNGWRNSENNITAYTIENQTITLYDAIKGKSLFCGWYLDEECKNHIATIDASTMCDYTVYAYADDSATKGLSIENGIVKGYSGTLTDVVIPSYYKGYNVTSIGSSAFYYCSGLTSIIIPDSVTSIASGTFRGCSGLTNMTLPFVGASKTASNGYDQVFGYIFGYIINNSSVPGVTLQYYSSPKYYYYYIPSSIKSVTITGGEIPYEAFYNCSGLTSVTIGNGVTSIGERAFESCTGLTSITIPDSVTSIGYQAFQSCSGLTSVTIGNSVTSIGYQAFYGCSKLQDIYITDIAAWCNISGLGRLMDYGSSNKNLYINNELVTSVIIPDGVTSIPSSAFEYCSSLTSMTIPDSVTSIGEYAFYNCTGLTSVTIGNGVTSIGNYAFYGCSGLTSITIPDSVTNIGYDAFYNCTGLASVTIGNGVTSIGGYAFSGCIGLTSITIPDSVTSVGNSAFSYCSGLTSITIPDSVTSIGSSAFSGCNSLTHITIPFVGAKAGVTSSDADQYPFGYIFGTNSYTGGAATEQYYNYSTSSMRSNTYYIPSSLKSVTVTCDILYGAFYNCSGLTSVTIGNGVTSIGSYAFYNCSGLTSITIRNGVTSIGERAFYGCTGLASVTIPGSVTSIGDYAFSGCSGLTSITIGNGVTSIGNYAFYGCSGLTSITIPDSVTSIDFSAFENCSGLTSIIIPDSVTSIGSDAFYGCSSLTSVTMGNSVTSIGKDAFSGCDKLQNIYITDIAAWCTISGLTYLMGYGSSNKNLYLNNKLVTSLAIPDGVTSIGSSAFSSCTGLTSIDISDNVTSIASGAFRGCRNLTSITLPFIGASKTASNGYDQVFGYIFGYDSSASSISGATCQYGYYYYYIPSSIKSVTITGESIPNNAFYGCSGVTSITIPDSVTSIGSSAFYGCTSLTNITIPNSVTSIGYYAFRGCSGLTSVTIGNGVTSIGERAFDGCTGLTSITIPDSVTSIGYGAFQDCTGLTSITIPNSVTSIGSSALLGCTGLTSVTIGNGVTSIGSSVFSGCSGLTSIVIPNSVTSIASGAFKGCTGLTSIIIPDSVTSIDISAFDETAWYNNQPGGLVYAGKIAYKYKGAMPSNTSIVIKDGTLIIGSSVFEYHTGLTSITIPDSVTSIGDRTFYNCSGLTSITIPDSVTSIGNSAFSHCTGLTSVTIGNGVTSIGSSAFSNCNGLTSISVGVGNTKYHSSGNCLIETATKTLILGCQNSVIPSDGSVTIICEYAFAGCSSLTSITIPDSVTSIGESAFYGCKGLTSITIPDSVTSIGDRAFYNCSGLTSITIPDSVTSIGERAFLGCTGLTSVTIGNGVTSIGSSAFEYCSGLTSVTIGNGVTSIGERAFLGCTGLTSITIPNSVKSIGSSAFSGCSGLTSVTIPDSVKSIGSSAFSYCSGLTSITIPDSVKSIGWGAFEYCSGLTSVTIGNGETSIGTAVFRGCTGLTSITIPNSVTSICEDAFYGCSSLTSVTIGNSVTRISNDVFSGCSSLTSINFNGTKAQWNAISKSPVWNYNTGSYTVYCTDGTIPKSN